MKNRTYLLLLAFLLTACTTSTPSIQTLSTQTAASPSPVTQASPIPPSPTETTLPTQAAVAPSPVIQPTSRSLNPTQTPLTTLATEGIASQSLESILVQPGDLPEGYTAGDVTNAIPAYIDLQGTTCPYRINQGFEQNGENAGGVTLVACASNDQAMFSIGYDMAGWGDVNFQVQDIGENMALGTLVKNRKAGLDGMNVLFTRCDVVVYIRITGITDQETILTYAKKLDERLAPLVCQ